MIKRTLTISAALLTARVLVVAERRCLKASQTMTLGAKGTLTITNNDVMPHKLIETSGPAVRMQTLRRCRAWNSEPGSTSYGTTLQRM